MLHHGWFVKRFISDFSCTLLYMTLEALLWISLESHGPWISTESPRSCVLVRSFVRSFFHYNKSYIHKSPVLAQL